MMDMSFAVRIAMVFMVTSVLEITRVFGHPADHREDTVLPFSLSPGNVNLETYYLNKYPQPGVPGGPLGKNKPTTQMAPSPLDPVHVPEAGGNMFLVPKIYDPHAVFRSRRAAGPEPHHFVSGGNHHYPYGGHNHGHLGLALYNEDSLHLHHHPRYEGGGSRGSYHNHNHNHMNHNHYTSHHPNQYQYNSQHPQSQHFHSFPHN